MAVKVWRRRLAWTFASALPLLGGCMAHVTGMVRDDASGLHLQTPEGREVRLLLNDDSAPIAYLDDLIVDVSGRRSGRAVAVDEWTVREGQHGLPTWVGVLVRRGVELGLQDRNSGVFYFVGPGAEATLAPFVGKHVLLEGYVEGAHRVRVVYYRVLDDQTPPPAGR